MMKARGLRLFTFADALLIAAIIAVSAVMAYFFIFGNNEGLCAVVRYNGEVVQNIDLESVKEPYCIDVGNVTMYIEKDGVSIINSPCRDKQCIHTGKINRQGQSAVCLPERVSVELTGGDNKFDTVVG